MAFLLAQHLHLAALLQVGDLVGLDVIAERDQAGGDGLLLTLSLRQRLQVAGALLQEVALCLQVLQLALELSALLLALCGAIDSFFCLFSQRVHLHRDIHELGADCYSSEPRLREGFDLLGFGILRRRLGGAGAGETECGFLTGLLHLEDGVLEVEQSLLEGADLQLVDLLRLEHRSVLLVQAALQDAHAQLSLAHGFARLVVLAREGSVCGGGGHELALQPADQQVVVAAALQASAVLSELTDLTLVVFAETGQRLCLLACNLRQLFVPQQLPLCLFN